MRTLLGCALGLLCCGLTADDKKDDKIDATKLVGKWEPKEKKEGGSAVIEYTKDGKMVYTVVANGTETKVEGTYKLDGNKLTMTIKVGDMERTRTRTISKLTDTEMVGADEKGKEATLIRITGK